jgi:hypothetical protein
MLISASASQPSVTLWRAWPSQDQPDGYLLYVYVQALIMHYLYYAMYVYAAAPNARDEYETSGNSPSGIRAN